jgi:hypothetical protein
MALHYNIPEFLAGQVLALELVISVSFTVLVIKLWHILLLQCPMF